MATDPALRSLADALDAGMSLRVLADDPTLVAAWPAPLRIALQKTAAGRTPLGTALLEAEVLDDGPAAIIDAGEAGGFVPKALRLAADGIAAARARRRRALLALAYPAFLVAAGAVILPLPLLFSDGLGAWVKVALPIEVALAATLGLVFVVVPRLPRRMRQQLTGALTRVPFIGVIVVEDARAAGLDILGALLGAGASLTSSLPAAVRATGLPARFNLARVEGVVHRGGTLADALAQGGLVDDSRAGLVALAERTGTLDKTLPLLAKEAGEIARRRFTALLGLFGLACFFAVAAVIGVAAVRGMGAYVDAIDNAARE